MSCCESVSRNICVYVCICACVCVGMCTDFCVSLCVCVCVCCVCCESLRNFVQRVVNKFASRGCVSVLFFFQ